MSDVAQRAPLCGWLSFGFLPSYREYELNMGPEWRLRDARIGPREDLTLSLSTGIGPSDAGEQRANGFGSNV